jgi:hypothetical protein
MQCRLWLGCATVLLTLAGCSLITVKSPERPLSTQELNARILVREEASQFMQATDRWGGRVAATERDAAVFENSLRWEIAAVAASRSAATQIAPMMGLLDSWALALQMQSFVSDGGAGAALFGTHQAAVREMTDNFADGMQTLARRLLKPQDFTTYQDFVTRYARDNPLRDLALQRPSVIERWSREKGGEAKLADSLGTIPQALADVEQRMQIYGDTVPTQTLRTSQLALRASGYSTDDMHAALQRLDERLARLTAVAESTPELLHGAEEDVRQSVHEILNRLEAASTSAAQTLHQERVELFAEIQTEREALVSAADAQRRQLVQDAAGIADRVVKTSGAEVRRLTREVMLLLTLFIVVVLGLPFAAGYLVGRAALRRRP